MSAGREEATPQVGWKHPDTGEELTFEDALAEAEAYGEWAGFPFEALQALYEGERRPRPSSISVTQILGCPRQVYLQRKHDYYVPPVNNWWTFRGHLVHDILERSKAPDAVTETRLERVHRGVVISGQPDSVRAMPVNRPNGTKYLLRDWKSRDELPMFDNAYTHHQQQTNIYRWLLCLPAEETDIEVVYFSMKGVKVIPLKRGGVNRNGRAIPQQVWSDEQVEEFLDKRLMVLAASLEQDRPVAYEAVDEEDLWQCEDYCPVKDICHRLAVDEAEAAWAKGQPVDRFPARRRKKK